MRTGNHTQRSVITPTFVQMKSDGEHASHNFARRLHVHDSRLRRPRTKSFNVLALADGNRQVLMPSDLPVRCSRLIEENSPNRETFGSKDSLHDFADGTRCGKCLNTLNGEEVSFGTM